MHCQMLYRQVNLFELYSVLLGLKPFEPDHSIPYIIASAHRLHVRTSKLVGNALTHLLLILSFYGLQTIRAGEKIVFSKANHTAFILETVQVIRCSKLYISSASIVGDYIHGSWNLCCPERAKIINRKL